MLQYVSASAEEVQPLNNDDTTFSFGFSFFGKDNTSGRRKDNDSSTYVKCTTCPSSGFQVYVDGANSADAFWWDDGMTIGSPRISRVGKFLVRQWVYESGYSYARLGGYRSSGSGQAVGVWSPDYDPNYDSSPYAVSLN